MSDPGEFHLGVAQLTSTNSVSENLAQIERLYLKAVHADLVVDIIPNAPI